MKVLDNSETNLLVLWLSKGELLYSSVGKLIHGHWIRSSICMCRNFQKVSLSTFYVLVLFIPKHPIVEEFLAEQPPKSFKIYFTHTKKNQKT